MEKPENITFSALKDLAQVMSMVIFLDTELTVGGPFKLIKRGDLGGYDTSQRFYERFPRSLSDLCSSSLWIF
jgi:hypothetical protein